MKKILLFTFLILFTSSALYSKSKKDVQRMYEKVKSKTSGDFVFSCIDTISYKSKDDLFFLTKSFFVENYPNDIILLEDKDKGVISWKSVYEDNYRSRRFMGQDLVAVIYTYYIKIQCREGRYKADISDVSFVYYTEDSMEPSPEYRLSEFNDEFMEGFKEEKKKEGEPKRSMKNIGKRNAYNDKGFRKLVYSVLDGINNNTDKTFNLLKKHMVIAGIEYDKDNW